MENSMSHQGLNSVPCDLEMYKLESMNHNDTSVHSQPFFCISAFAIMHPLYLDRVSPSTANGTFSVSLRLTGP